MGNEIQKQDTFSLIRSLIVEKKIKEVESLLSTEIFTSKQLLELMMISKHDETIFKLILNQQKNINEQNDNDETILIHLFKKLAPLKNIDEVLNKKLIDLDIIDKKGNNVIIYALKNSFPIKIIKKLIYCNLNQKNNKNRTPLMYAVKYGTYKHVRLLLKNNVDVNAVDDENDSALLMLLRKEENEDTIRQLKLLLLKDCDIEGLNFKGGNPLMYSSGIYGLPPKINSTRLLLECGANPNNLSGNKHYLYLLYQLYQCKKVPVEMIGMFIQYGAKINQIPEDNDLFLILNEMGYIKTNIYELLKYLSDKSTTIRIKDCDICLTKGIRLLKCDHDHYTCFICNFKLKKRSCEFCNPR